MSFSGLRSGARSVAERDQKRAGKGRYKTFLQMQIPKLTDEIHRRLRPTDKLAEPFVFIPATYQNWNFEKKFWYPSEAKHFLEHNIQRFENGKQRFKKFPCSAGIDLLAPQPCLGEYLEDRGEKGVGAKDQFVWNVAHLIRYHLVEYEKDGKVIADQKTKKPVMIMVECVRHQVWAWASDPQAQDCKYCQINQHQPHQEPYPFFYGMHKYFQIGMGHLKTVDEWAALAGSRCRNCGTYLKVSAYSCSNMQCRQPLLSIAQVATIWNNEQIEAYSKSQVTCQYCQQSGTPVATHECGYDQNGQKYQGYGCQGRPAEPLTIYDFVFEAQREGSGTDTEIKAQMYPIGQYTLFAGSPQETIVTPQLIQQIVQEPFNFDEMFAPWPTKEQAAFLGMADPYSNVPQHGAQQGGYAGPPYTGQSGPPAGAPPAGPPFQQPQGYQPPGAYQGPPGAGGVSYPNVPSAGRPKY